MLVYTFRHFCLLLEDLWILICQGIHQFIASLKESDTSALNYYTKVWGIFKVVLSHIFNWETLTNDRLYGYDNSSYSIIQENFLLRYSYSIFINLVPLRENHSWKRQTAKVSIGKGLKLLRLVGYFHHAALVVSKVQDVSISHDIGTNFDIIK